MCLCIEKRNKLTKITFKCEVRIYFIFPVNDQFEDCGGEDEVGPPLP